MSRLQEIAELSREMLEECFAIHAADLRSQMEEHPETYVEPLVHAIQAAVDQAVRMQREQTKGPIAYLSFSLPLSSILMERYALGVHLYGEEWFLDEMEVCQTWSLSFLKPYLERDMQAIEPILNTRLIRLKRYELLEWKRAYVFRYLGVVLESLPDWIVAALERVEWGGLQRHAEIMVTFGLYMEKQKLLCRWEGKG